MDPIQQFWQKMEDWITGAPGVLIGITVGIAGSIWMFPYAVGYWQLQEDTQDNMMELREHEQEITQLHRQSTKLNRTMDEINRNLRIAVCTRNGSINVVAYRELNCQEFE